MLFDMSIPVTLAKGDRFHVEALVNSETKKAIIRPTGFIDENTDFDSLLEYITKIAPGLQEMTFDLGHIDSLNSLGARAWLIFLEKAEALVPLKFEKVSEVLVDLAGIVPNVLGTAKVSLCSFCAPYYCPKCDRRAVQILTPSAIHREKGTFVPPTFTCNECKSELEFDGHPDEYFGFLK